MRPFRRPSGPAVIALAAALFVPVARAAAGPEAAAALAEADRLWGERGEGATSGEVPAARIDPVLAACRRAVELDPDSVDGRWRMMRALYFKGEHTTRDPEEKKKIFDEGRKAGDEAIALVRRKVAAATGRATEKEGPVALAKDAKAIPGAAATFLWAGVNWGKWAIVYGKSAAARQGAAAKIRDDAQAVILIDPLFEEGGGYRLLGRLHHQTPFIPFITGWASRTEALRNLKLAMEAGPRHFYNRLYWAEALWDYEKDRRDEARRILQVLAADTPSGGYRVEDLRAQEEARALLEKWSH